MNSMFNRITDQAAIKKILRNYMLKPDEQVAPFLPAIKLKQPNLIIEGARPLSSMSEPGGGVFYSLTDSDSGYRCAKHQVALSNIEYIETLRARF